MDEPTTERGWWDLLITQTPQSVAQKALFDDDYANIRRYVQSMGGMRDCARFCAEYALQGGLKKGFFDGLNVAHPRALMLIAEYGDEMKPAIWPIPPAIEPRPRACYANSFGYQWGFNKQSRKIKDGVRLDYVEGIAFGGRTSAVLHAWNSIERKIAVDTSWYAVTGWTFYFGISLSQWQYDRLRNLAYPSGSFHLLFKPDVFPRIEEPLTRILKRRKTKPPA